MNQNEEVFKRFKYFTTFSFRIKKVTQEKRNLSINRWNRFVWHVFCSHKIRTLGGFEKNAFVHVFTYFHYHSMFRDTFPRWWNWHRDIVNITIYFWTQFQKFKKGASKVKLDEAPENLWNLWKWKLCEEATWEFMKSVGKLPARRRLSDRTGCIFNRPLPDVIT